MYPFSFYISSSEGVKQDNLSSKKNVLYIPACFVFGDWKRCSFFHRLEGFLRWRSRRPVVDMFLPCLSPGKLLEFLYLSPKHQCFVSVRHICDLHI